jgi:lysophospholipase L1-like esterase
MDGGGKTSAWGVENIATHFSRHHGVCIIEFGHNDQWGETPIAAADTAANLITMAKYVEGLGANAIIGIVAGTTTDWTGTYVPTIEAACSSAGVSYVKLYDAVDTSPGNGEPETLAEAYVAESVHPNVAGHTAMAAALWSKICELGWV